MTILFTLLFHMAWMLPVLMMLAFVVEKILQGTAPALIHRVWLAVLPVMFFSALIATLLHSRETYAQTIRTQVGMHITSRTVDNHPGLTADALNLPRVVGDALLLVFLVAVLIAVLRLVLTMLSVRKLLREASPVELEPEFEASFDRIRRSLDIPMPLLLQSKNVRSPIVVGVTDPSIICPQNFFEGLQMEEFNAAIAHECAHIARRDYAANLSLRIAAIQLAWHPCTPLLFRAMAASREMATDRLAADVLGSSDAYAVSLLNLWKQLTLPKPQPQGIGIFDANILQERVMQIVKKPIRISNLRRALIAVACVPFFVLTALAANALRLQVQAPNIATRNDVQRGKTRILIHSANPEWPADQKDHSKKTQSTVLVGMIVDAAGVPQNVHIVKSGGASFDEKAMEAVQQYRFKPGAPLDMKVEVHFETF